MGKDKGIEVLYMGLWMITKDVPVISHRDFGMGKDTVIGVLCIGLLGICLSYPFGTLGWEKKVLCTKTPIGICLSYPL